MPRARSATARNPNRTDLAAPVTAPTGQPYGVRAQQIAAQGAIPMGQQPVASPGPGPGAPPPPIDMAAMQAGMAQHAAIHGPPQPLNRPTERPNEPVTHGLPVGPGGGPEALQGVGAAARDNAVEGGTLKNLLMGMAQSPGATSAIRDLAARAQGGAL